MYRIGTIPGDGTGPEVTAEAVKVLEAVASENDIRYELVEYDVGGERYKRTGEVLPNSVRDELGSMDAAFLGAIGHPDVKPGILEKGILLELRFFYEMYINLRPVRHYPGVWTPIKDKGPQDIDFVVVRENTEGIYKGLGEFRDKGTPDEVAIQISENSRRGVERCVRYAFELTRKRDRKELTLVGKTNVLTYAMDLWDRVFHEVGREYPDIKLDYAHVDATCMWMVKNPEWFDVIVTDNLFGDIITDLAAMIQGGLGIAAGGNIRPGGFSMFEPMGGSAPKYAGKGMINPLAAISAMGMLLDFLGEETAAKQVEQAIMSVTSEKIQSLSAGQMGYSTSQVGDLITSFL